MKIKKKGLFHLKWKLKKTVVVVFVVAAVVEEEEYVCRWVHAWPTFLDQRGIHCIPPPSPLCSVVSAPDIPRHTPAPNLLTHSDENVPKIQIIPKVSFKSCQRCLGGLADKSERRHLWHGRQGKSASPPSFRTLRWVMLRCTIHQQYLY